MCRLPARETHNNHQPVGECIFLYAVLMSVSQPVKSILNYHETVVIILMKTLTAERKESGRSEEKNLKTKFQQ